jgi:hypothetical protein
VVQHSFVNEGANQPATIPPGPGRRKLRWRWILAGAGVAVAIFVVLAYFPVGQSSSFEIDPCLGEQGYVNVPLHTVLSVTWSSVSGAPTGIQIEQDGILFQSPQPSGNGSFEASGYGGVTVSAYTDVSPCVDGVTQVHLTWQAAVLWSWVEPN